MTTPTQNQAPGHNARQLLKELQETFPVFRDSLPLAIGIDKQLQGRLPNVGRKDSAHRSGNAHALAALPESDGAGNGPGGP
jgi:hypothetical protein